jgi:uncharacterized OB-fold protein
MTPDRITSDPLATTSQPSVVAAPTAIVGENSIGEAILKPGSDGVLHLQGSRCPQCDDIRYPSQVRCPHDLTLMEPVDLSDEGRLYAAVRVDLAPQGFEQPYWVGYIDLPDGVRVFAPLRCDVELPPSDGDAVGLVIGTVRNGVQAPMYERKLSDR